MAIAQRITKVPADTEQNDVGFKVTPFERGVMFPESRASLSATWSQFLSSPIFLQQSPGREVVRDGLLVLAEGDRVPADALLLQGSNLSVDESLLAGKSVPVRKSAYFTPVS